MIAGTHELEAGDGVRASSVRLPYWRCGCCGIKRPRLED
jgi:hypothetical protein